MSMITGCPACGTLFKVVADQLKISDGWVRCGHCAEIFDASAHLQPDAPPAQADQPDALAAAQAVDVPVTAPMAALASDARPDDRAGPEPVVGDDAPALTPWSAPSTFGPPSHLGDDEPSYLPVHLVRAESEAAAARSEVFDDEPEPEPGLDELPLDDVSFVRHARRKAFWRRPLVRAALALAFVGLAALLAAQVALQERDRLASAQPGLLPLLQRLCEPLACRVGPPRRIEAIAIDSSGFTKLRQDTYRLSVTLKNQAPAPVAVPALELTLTDSQDQPVVRRVLTPGELGAPADTIASAADWSTSVAIAVGGGGAARVAGYRLLAFYP